MRLILILVILSASAFCQAQWSIPTEAYSFEIDDLGNVYLVHENRVEMRSSEGELLFVYNPSFTNRISHVDVSLALRPLVFFKDQGMLQYLDNTLSEQNDLVDLYRQPFGRVELVAASVDNHVWVFDSVNMELSRLDKSLSVVSRSGNLGSWIAADSEFVELREYQDALYLIGPSGVFVFDLFGNFDRTLSAGPIYQVFFGNDRVYFEQNETWIVTDRSAIPIKESCLPLGKTRAQVKGNDLFVLDSGVFTNSVLNKE